MFGLVYRRSVSYNNAALTLKGLGHWHEMLRGQMDNGNLFNSFRLPFAGGNLMHRVQNIGAVVAIATLITNTDDHVFEQHKA